MKSVGSTEQLLVKLRYVKTVFPLPIDATGKRTRIVSVATSSKLFYPRH